jgi:general secretion pathway protein K
MRETRHGRHSGVALISALLVVALATVAAVSMASRQHVDIRRTANLLDADQSFLYELGAEGWGAQILARDRQDNQVDHLGEDWATLLFPISVPGGTIAAAIEDMQGRFNINSLVEEGKVSEIALSRFRRLLELHELDPAIADAVLDWIDQDIDLRFPAGAEDDAYLNATPPYRTGNAPMASTSELRLVKGVTREAYEVLAPLLSALPTATPVNVNTASVPVLMALADGITESDAAALVDARGDAGYASVDDFVRQDALAGRKITAEGLAVASDYFMVRAEAKIGRAQVHMNSLLRRDAGGQVSVVWRSRGRD